MAQKKIKKQSKAPVTVSAPVLEPALEPVLPLVALPEEPESFTIRRIEAQASASSPEVTEALMNHLVKSELLNEAQKAEALRDYKHTGENIAVVLLRLKFLNETALGQAFGDFYHCPFVALQAQSVPVAFLRLLPKGVIEKSQCVIYSGDDKVLRLAMVNPLDHHFVHLVEKKTGKRAEVHYTTPFHIEQALKSYPAEFEDQFSRLLTRASENFGHLSSLENISQVFDSLVLMAFQRKASDVHMEPFEDGIRVRFRVDGILTTITTLPKRFLETVINHIKVLANLRTDEHNASQDGRFKITYEKTTINFRVSVMPTYHGEKAVLRLLTSETQELGLKELGYDEKDREVIERYMKKSHGMILCVGPTGSGKTTTLYAILKELNHEGINISTIEDPIEYGLPGMVQIQVNPRTNITYADGLKSLLRQDPDLLMIGEIRDFETGKIAVNAALTGHLLFSTLHTNTASQAPLRLLQMGVDPYLVTSTVNLIVAQRLVRHICPFCITSFVLKPAEIAKFKQEFGLSPDQIKLFEKYFGSAEKSKESRLLKGKGCKKCGDTGFFGRFVIAEVLEVKGKIPDLILKSASESDLQAAAEEQGMTTMLEDGLKKVQAGLTTLEEIFRVINQ